MCESLSRVQLFVTPWTVVRQVPLSMEPSRQEYWSGLPFPTLGNLPSLGIEPLALQSDSLPSELPGSPTLTEITDLNKGSLGSAIIFKHILI